MLLRLFITANKPNDLAAVMATAQSDVKDMVRRCILVAQVLPQVMKERHILAGAAFCHLCIALASTDIMVAKSLRTLACFLFSCLSVATA